MGHIMTSLDMAGANFSILKVDPFLVSLIDAECDFPGWPKLTQPSGMIHQKSDIITRQLVDDTKVRVVTRFIQRKIAVHRLLGIVNRGRK